MWRETAHGWRPREVALWAVKVDQWGTHCGRIGREPVADVKLPNWDAAWAEAVDLSEDALPLAA